ncbi:hypothetical protein HYR53_10895 [Candidatus Acetothermia bacterium]|nr:hypothetical protein [Candidatus Acetothermia bacterium]
MSTQRSTSVIRSLTLLILGLALLGSISATASAQAMRPLIVINSLLSVSPAQPLAGQIIQITLNTGALFALGLAPINIQVLQYDFGDGRESTTTFTDPQYKIYNQTGFYTVHVKVLTTFNEIDGAVSFQVGTNVLFLNLATVETPLAQFDLNGNDRLEDQEFFALLDAWVQGQVADTILFKAVDIWVQDVPISSMAAAGLTNSGQQTQAHISTRGVTFTAQGQQTQEMAVQVYSPNGSLLFQQQRAGRTLTWNLLNASGAPVANGVYFYVIESYGANGKLIRSNPQAISILR